MRCIVCYWYEYLKSVCTFLILDAIIPMPYICGINYVRNRDYLSKPKEVHEQKSLENTALDHYLY